MKFFSLIYQGEVHTAPDEKIIPQEQYSELLEAHEVILKAKEDAAKLRQETEKECKELHKQAEEKGFSEGLEKFNEQMLFFDSELKRIRHETLQAVLPLALQAAKKIVAKELETHPETIVDIVLATLAPITHHRKIKIFASKQDRDLLEKEKTKVRDILQQVESLTVQERHDITPGGCIIETEAGIINATIENQWRALESAFERYKQKR